MPRFQYKVSVLFHFKTKIISLTYCQSSKHFQNINQIIQSQLIELHKTQFLKD